MAKRRKNKLKGNPNPLPPNKVHSDRVKVDPKKDRKDRHKEIKKEL